MRTFFFTQHKLFTSLNVFPVSLLPSIVMTTCSTILSLGMMPLLLYVYCHGFPNLHGLVPFRDILMALVMILFPCGTGVLINYYRPQYAQTFRRVRWGEQKMPA